MKLYEIKKDILAGDVKIKTGTIFMDKGNNYVVFHEFCTDTDSIKKKGLSFIAEKKDLLSMIDLKAIKSYKLPENTLQ